MLSARCWPFSMYEQTSSEILIAGITHSQIFLYDSQPHPAALMPSALTLKQLGDQFQNVIYSFDIVFFNCNISVQIWSKTMNI